jgi:hypothetical protein
MFSNVGYPTLVWEIECSGFLITHYYNMVHVPFLVSSKSVLNFIDSSAFIFFGSV